MSRATWVRWWRSIGERELRGVAMQHWDPIGVADVPEAADEYDSYLGQIGRHLRDGATSEDLASVLTGIATVQMGLSPRPQADLAAAREMRRWYDASTANFSNLS